jgi:hypothetical protein
MKDIPEYFTDLENLFLETLRRVVSRPRTTLLDPPVPLELIQNEIANFRKHSALRIEQATRNVVYRIAVRPLYLQY